MKIKSLLLTLCLLGSIAVYGQKGELNKGKASYNQFNEVKSLGTPALGRKDLEAAKTSLEKASENSKTSELSETWTYLALVYADFSTIDSANTEDYTNKTIAALDKAKTLEGHEEQAQNIDATLRVLAQNELTKGVKAFEVQDFAKAYSNFNKGLEYLPGDTLFSYYAGLAAINAKDYTNAVEKYKLLLTHDDFSSLGQVYLDLSRIFMMQEDTASAIKYANEGAAKFPDFADLTTQKIELNLQAGNEDQIISDIETQISKDPSDKRLQYYLGIAYGATGDDNKAEAAYKKAVELDPSFADAYVNLGGLMLNKGIKVFRSASSLPTNEQDKYTEAVKQGNALIEEAFPYLQKATETGPSNEIAWQNLKTYYQLKDDKAKMAEIDEKLKSL